MKINIICYEDIDAWIIGKIARRLTESLGNLGHQVTLGKEVLPEAEINHHITFHSYQPTRSGVHTVMVTHIDNAIKLARLKQALETARAAVCMSSEGVRNLVQLGFDPGKLEYAHMAHDGQAKVRRIVIGICTRLYPDGRKRESDVVRLLDVIGPKLFSFKIMGFGWAPIVEDMRKRGYEVEYHQDFEYEKYVSMLASLDYFLYLGEDEGSAAFIDALAAGVKTIVQPQGFHLDAPGGLTYAFKTYVELESVFATIALDTQQRIGSVADWTWENYARKHLQIWENCLAGRPVGGHVAGMSIESSVWKNLKRRAELWVNVFTQRFRMVLNLNRDYECGSRIWAERMARKKAAGRKEGLP